MPELFLQGEEIGAFPEVLDREAVAELVRRDPSADACASLKVTELAARIGVAHRLASVAAAHDRDDRAGWDLLADPHPGLKLSPVPVVDHHDPSLVAFAVTDEQRLVGWHEVALDERERFADSDAGAVQNHDESSESHR